MATELVYRERQVVVDFVHEEGQVEDQHHGWKPLENDERLNPPLTLNSISIWIIDLIEHQPLDPFWV